MAGEIESRRTDMLRESPFCNKRDAPKDSAPPDTVLSST